MAYGNPYPHDSAEAINFEAEWERTIAILTSQHAVDRRRLSERLAGETDLSIAEVETVLAAAPAESRRARLQ